MINRATGLLVTVFFLCSTALSGGDDRFLVNKTGFCVPKSAIVDIDIPWIPPELPKDGFVFQLRPQELLALVPALDVRGQKIPLVGSVTPSDANSINTSLKLFARRADSPESIIERNASSKLVFVYESSQRNHWTAWQLPADVVPNGDTLERLGVLVAACRKPAGVSKVENWKGSQATCQRRLYLDRVKVDYSMDVANLARFHQLDDQVKKHVLSWRCPS